MEKIYKHITEIAKSMKSLEQMGVRVDMAIKVQCIYCGQWFIEPDIDEFAKHLKLHYQEKKVMTNGL